MAGALKVRITANLTGIGEEINIDSGETTMTVPTEVLKGYTITEGATTTGIALLAGVANIALAKVYGVYIKAEVGTIYVTLQTDGTTGSSAITTSADLTLLAGEACYLPYNWNKTSVAGILVNGSAATDAFSWAIFGKA